MVEWAERKLPEIERLYTLAQVAGALGWAVYEPYRRVAEGTLFVYRLGRAGLRVPESEVERINKNKAAALRKKVQFTRGNGETFVLDKDPYEIAELAYILHTSNEYLYRFIREGELPASLLHVGASRPGPDDVMVIRRDDVKVWLKTKM